jgi:hypothetical protein
MNKKLHLIASNDEGNEMIENNETLQDDDSSSTNSVETNQATKKRDTSHVTLLDLDFGQTRNEISSSASMIL